MDWRTELPEITDDPDWSAGDQVAGKKVPPSPAMDQILLAIGHKGREVQSLPMRRPDYNQNSGGTTNNRDMTTEQYYFARIHGVGITNLIADAVWYGTCLINGGSEHEQGKVQDAHSQWGPMLGPIAALKCVDNDSQHRLESGFFNGYKQAWNSKNRDWWEKDAAGFTLRPFLRLMQNLVRYGTYMTNMKAMGFYKGDIGGWPALPAEPADLLMSAKRGMAWFLAQKYEVDESRGFSVDAMVRSWWIDGIHDQRGWLYVPDKNPHNVGKHTTPFMLYYMWPELAGWWIDLNMANETFHKLNRNWCTWALSMFCDFDGDFGCAKNKKDTFTPPTTWANGPYKSWRSTFASPWARENSEPDFHWPLVGAIRYTHGTIAQRLEALKKHHETHRWMPGALHHRYVYDAIKLLENDA